MRRTVRIVALGLLGFGLALLSLRIVDPDRPASSRRPAPQTAATGRSRLAARAMLGAETAPPDTLLAGRAEPPSAPRVGPAPRAAARAASRLAPPGLPPLLPPALRATPFDPRSVPKFWCLRVRNVLSASPETSAQDAYRVASELANVVDGEKSVAIASASATLPPGTGAVYWQSVAADTYRGKRLRVSASVFTEGQVGHLFLRSGKSARLVLEDVLGDGRAANAWFGNARFPGGYFTVVDDVPKDAAVIHYGVAVYGPGRVWIDRVRLERVRDNAPVTRQPAVVGDSSLIVGKPWIQQVPVNLSFEATVSPPEIDAARLHCTEPQLPQGLLR
jgi:hypothetical protein